MTRWTVVLPGLALAGCGGGSGDDDMAGQSGFDLTGCWAVNDRPLCTSDLHSGAELDELEDGRVKAAPWRVTQTGDDLDITDLEDFDRTTLEDGRPFHGTVEGSRVRYGDRDTVPGLEVVLDAEGTVVSEDAIEVVETYVFSSEGEAAEVVCAVRLERLPDVSWDECAVTLEDG